MSNKTGGRSLFHNAVFSVIYRLLNILFPLISSGYVARILTPDGIGRHAAVHNNVSYFVMLGSLGIQAYATREIAKRKDDKKGRDKLFSEMMIINAFMTVIAIIIFIVCLFFAPVFKAEIKMYLICSIALLFNFINVDWFFQGTEEFRFIAIRSFVIKALMLCAVFVFINTPEDLYKYALICVLANGGNYLINVIYACRTTRFSFKKTNVKRHFKALVFLALCAVSSELYARVDITMLDLFSNNQNVAFYTYAQKIIFLIVTTVSAITAVFLPRLSYLYETDKEKFNKLTKFGLDLMIFISFPAGIGLACVSYPLIRLWLGNDYLFSAFCLIVLALMIPFKCIGDIVCYQVMLCAGQELKLMISYFIIVTVNFLSNLFLIPRIGSLGASITSLFSEIFGFILIYAMAKKYMNFKSDKKNLIKVIFATFIMFIVLLVYEFLVKSVTISLIGGVLVGGSLYIILNILFKNKFFTKELLNAIKSR